MYDDVTVKIRNVIDKSRGQRRIDSIICLKAV